MGKRGPQKKPSALEELEGFPGKRPINKNEPKPPISVNVPTPPRWLDKDGKACWKREAPHAHALGLLTELDTAAFAKYCDCTSQWGKARDDLRINPADKNAGARYRNLLGILQRYEAAFGRTPSSRSGLSVATPEKQANPLAEFLQRKQKGNLN